MAYFDRVDVYEIEADLRVTNRAAEEGRRTKTAGSDAEIHDTQREIMGAIGERRNLARTSAEGTLKDIDVKLGDIDLGASHSLRSLGHLTRSSFELVLGRRRSTTTGGAGAGTNDKKDFPPLSPTAHHISRWVAIWLLT